MTREVSRTDDGRYVVVDGRRWRTAGPALPDDVRTRLLTTWGGPVRRANGGECRGEGAVADARARWEAALRALDG